MSAATQLPRLLNGAVIGRAMSMAEHARIHGVLPHPGSALIEQVEHAGLRGRGGALFPLATKLSTVAGARTRPVLVANGAEGEPASRKDRLLLESVPHLVLDGAVLAAEAIGAREAIICTREGAASQSLGAALVERDAPSRGRVALNQAFSPDTYLAGEESALVSVLNGGPARPTLVPPRPFERGVGRRPTLMANVETLAHLALICRHGSAWFRELGTASEPGSTLITLSGTPAGTNVWEVARGALLADLVRSAGGAGEQVRAVLVGGYFGTWLDGSLYADLTLEDAGLAAHGAALGCGVVHLFGTGACGPAEVARVASYMAGQSAHQCGPCHFGLPAIAGGLETLRSGRASAQTLTDLERWLGQVSGRGACQHPTGAVRFVASALDVFAAEWRDHAAYGACSACAAPPRLPVPRPIAVAA